MANLLNAESEAALTTMLASLETKTKHQLVVVTMPSLNGQPIERLSRCLGNGWGIGRASADDGVLLVVAPTERKVRIEVGKGLETILSNAEAKLILDQEVLPLFQDGNFPVGIRAGAARIAAEIS